MEMGINNDSRFFLGVWVKYKIGLKPVNHTLTGKNLTTPLNVINRCKQIILNRDGSSNNLLQNIAFTLRTIPVNIVFLVLANESLDLVGVKVLRLCSNLAAVQYCFLFKEAFINLSCINQSVLLTLIDSNKIRV